MRAALGKAATAIVLLGVLVAWILGRSGWADAASGAFAAPFLTAWSRLSHGLSEMTQSLVPGPNSHADRADQMQARMRQLEVENAQLDEVLAENARLRRSLDLVPPPRYEVITAAVVARDPIIWDLGFRIAKGERNGVALGAAVLADGYVVGRVTELHNTHAVITTVASPACRLAVVLPGSGATGILTGRAGREPVGSRPDAVVQFLPKNIEVQVGEIARTSGLGTEIPAGLPVAAIAGELGEPRLETVQGGHQRANVTPLASFRRIRFVDVVCPAN